MPIFEGLCLRYTPPARPSSAAYALGLYFNLEMAAKTFAFVMQETFAAPFTTRDTDAVETPASLATSFTVDGRRFF